MSGLWQSSVSILLGSVSAAALLAGARSVRGLFHAVDGLSARVGRIEEKLGIPPRPDDLR